MVKRHIPNGITLGNLLCGCLGITWSFQNEPYWPIYMIYLAAFLDFMDGFAARMLRVSSPIGKELDSLADMVTFGLLPSVITFQLLKTVSPYPYLPYTAFLIPLCAALRLAKFNTDTRQSDVFLGLPTPANALFFSGLPFISYSPYNHWISWQGLLVLILVFSFLMVSELRLFSLKFKDFQWKNNQIRFIFIVLSAVLITSLGGPGLPLTIVLYILMSLFSKE